MAQVRCAFTAWSSPGRVLDSRPAVYIRPQFISFALVVTAQFCHAMFFPET